MHRKSKESIERTRKTDFRGTLRLILWMKTHFGYFGGSIMENIQTNGRDNNGRFTPGNPGGPGNPHAGSVSKLRAAILRAVDEGDIEAIIKKLVQQARGGDLPAVKELLDRCVGNPGSGDLIERIEALEAVAEQMQAEGVR